MAYSATTIATKEELLAALAEVGLPESVEEGKEKVYAYISAGDLFYNVCSFDVKTETVTGAVWSHADLCFEDFATDVADLVYPCTFTPEPVLPLLDDILNFIPVRITKEEQPA